MNLEGLEEAYRGVFIIGGLLLLVFGLGFCGGRTTAGCALHVSITNKSDGGAQ